MRKFLISIICALCMGTAFAAGENVATSKAFVDTAVAQKQDKIPANTNPNNSPDQVLTNTGTAGNVGTKDIYTASGEYANQMDSLVTAENMNAAVQTAIEAEFKCIKWVDDDPTKDCLLVKIVGPDIGIQPGDGEWVRAWISRVEKWEYYPDASSSIRIPIKPNIEYKLYWDEGYHGSIYRMGFTKNNNVPTDVSGALVLYKSDGTLGAEFRSDPQAKSSYIFTVTDSDIKYLVIQVGGYNEPWNNGDFSRLWNDISHLHLVQNNFLPDGN